MEKTEHIVTHWENDLTETIHPRVKRFAEDKYPDFELQMLSGLRHRQKEEIWQTISESFSIIINPNMLEESQIREIVAAISHSIWVNFNSNTNNINLRHFDFITPNPFEDALMIKNSCLDLKDNQGEPALTKIVKCIQCRFYGFEDELYEMECLDSWPENIKIIRYS